MLTLAAWVHDIDPFVFRVSGDFGVRWYGLAYIAGFVCAYLLMVWLALRGRIALSAGQVADLIFACVVGVVVGGRIGYAIFYQPSLFARFTADPPWWGLLALNQGGMASHGGMIGVILACAWMARRARTNTLHLLDLAALTAPVGLFFGRIANFINGELLGRIVATPGEPSPWWAVKFPQELLSGHAPQLTPEQQAQLAGLIERHRLHHDEPVVVALERLIRAVQAGAVDTTRELAPLLAARHPSQLYQAAAEGLILGAALWWMWRKPRLPGVIGAWFLLIYGALRIATEVWRLPDDHLALARVLGLSRGQWLSAAMMLAGAATLAILLRRGKGKAKLGGWLKWS